MHESRPTGARERDLLRLAAICGVVGQGAFVALWVVWGFVEKNYDVTRQDISDFGALDASHPLPYNIILSATGALTVFLALGLARALRPGFVALAGCLALVIFGVGEFLDGLLREDCSPSGNAACRAAADAGDLSWHHTAHDIESIVTIASVIVAPIVLAFVFRRRDEWRGLWRYSLLSAAVIIAFVVPYAIVFAANDGSEVSGLLERGAGTVAVVWIAVVSLRLWQLAGATPSDVPERASPAVQTSPTS